MPVRHRQLIQCPPVPFNDRFVNLCHYKDGRGGEKDDYPITNTEGKDVEGPLQDRDIEHEDENDALPEDSQPEPSIRKDPDMEDRTLYRPTVEGIEKLYQDQGNKAEGAGLPCPAACADCPDKDRK